MLLSLRKLYSHCTAGMYGLAAAALALTTSGCEDLFGSKDDPTVNEVLEQGAIDPELVPQDVGYVPIFPAWEGFTQPVDVFVGYDEMVYVVDERGLNVLDQTGAFQQLIPLEDAVEVTQNRRLVTYVTARVDTTVQLDRPGTENDTLATFSVPAVFSIRFTGTPDYEFLDTLVHPFDDGSRYTEARVLDQIDIRDEDVVYHGIDVNAQDEIYLARSGPTNDQTASYAPDNAIFFYSPEGSYIRYADDLSPTQSSLRSAIGVSGLATFSGPPQRQIGMEETPDFMYCQAARDLPVNYRVLWIQEVFDADAAQTTYTPNQDLLAQDTAQGNRFLYEIGRFQEPRDIYIAPDEPGYIFVVDAGLDSVFVFNQQGIEGVNPPPTANRSKQVIVSFGGAGSGPFQLNDPSGVCYHRGFLFIADKNNNRVVRYRLNTELE